MTATEIIKTELSTEITVTDTKNLGGSTITNFKAKNINGFLIEHSNTAILFDGKESKVVKPSTNKETIEKKEIVKSTTKKPSQEVIKETTPIVTTDVKKEEKVIADVKKPVVKPEAKDLTNNIIKMTNGIEEISVSLKSNIESYNAGMLGMQLKAILKKNPGFEITNSDVPENLRKL
jgi:hypothetical protein